MRTQLYLEPFIPGDRAITENNRRLNDWSGEFPWLKCRSGRSPLYLSVNLAANQKRQSGDVSNVWLRIRMFEMLAAADRLASFYSYGDASRL